MINFQNIEWKKVGMIAGFILVVLLVGYFIYALFFKAPAPTPTEEERLRELGQLPGAEVGVQPGIVPGAEVEGPGLPTEKITKIEAPEAFVADTVAQGSITKVYDLDYQINSSISLDETGNNLVSYQRETGQFYKIQPDGTKQLLTDRIYKDVENVAWAPEADQAILEFPDGTNVLYDFKADKQISLPKDWTNFDFNQTGDKIGFKDLNANSEYRWIGMSNPDGSGQKYLEHLGNQYNRFKIDWAPTGDKIAQYNPGASASTSRLLFVGLNGENYKAIDLRGYGIETQWTPDGSRILYSGHTISTDHKPVLNIVNASGDTIGYDHQSLNLNTWVNKCSFADKDTVYCAVPKELPYGASYAPEIADDIPDYIYKVNLKTGAKSFVAEPEYNYTIEQIQVSEDGSTLFFTDKTTQALHSIRLK